MASHKVSSGLGTLWNISPGSLLSLEKTRKGRSVLETVVLLNGQCLMY